MLQLLTTREAAVTLVLGSFPAADERAPFLEPLVLRISQEFAAERGEVHRRALEFLSGFRHARVRSFIPILVEKRLREAYRRSATSHPGEP
jgi:hypothetical protein